MRRRALLAGLGTAATGSVAGCLGSVTVRDTDDDQLTVAGEKRADSESELDDITVGVAAGDACGRDL